VIDPIDGTKNFVRGVPVWATLIALRDLDADAAEAPPGGVLVGVVSAPALGRRWWAARGRGAWVRVGDAAPRRLAVSQVGDLSDAYLSYSGPGAWAEAGRPGGLEPLMRRVWRTRAFGDFWSHVLVAEGAVDVAPEPELSIWDVAALQVIVEEAGGRFTSLDGQPRPDAGSGVSTNGRLHDEVLRALGS
jgi:histidinol-phosphatase